MKIVQKVLTIAFFSFLTQWASAANTTNTAYPEGVQIQYLLKNIDFDNYVEKETKMSITFFVNVQNEIIVVSTNNKKLDNVVKSSLNYKKIAIEELEYNKIYTVPVVIK